MNSKRRQSEQEIRRKLQSQRPGLESLLATGQYTPPVPQGAYLSFLDTIRRLRSVRRAAGLSLAEVARQTGIDKAALSRLENGVAENPTIGTVNRYAKALGKTLVMGIIDRPNHRRRTGAKAH